MNEKKPENSPLLDACITKNFGVKKVLAGARLQVWPGDVIMIQGRNGFGKSTFINIAGGLIPPSQGFVFWEGKCIYKIEEGACPDGPCSACCKANGVDLNAEPLINFDELRGDYIAFVLQEANLVENLTVWDNVCLPLIVRDKRADEQAVQKYIEMVGLYEYANTMVSKLSGGWRQRVNIARAFAASPKIIFADEPFSHVDQESQKAIWSFISQQKTKDPNLTMLIISHDDEVFYEKGNFKSETRIANKLYSFDRAGNENNGTERGNAFHSVPLPKDFSSPDGPVEGVCPRCNERLKHFSYEGIPIDRCIRCSGIWLDKDELNQLVINSGRLIEGKMIDD